MGPRVLFSRRLTIHHEDDVVGMRRAVRELAEARDFDSFATAALTTAATELGRNVWVHARGGEVLLEAVSDGERVGLRVEFTDVGPGIPDVERALAGGFSTARSLGLGLGGSRRLVDEFDIHSEVGRGTTVRILKWKRF